MTTLRRVFRAGRRAGLRQRQIARALGLHPHELLSRLGHQVPPPALPAARAILAIKGAAMPSPKDELPIPETGEMKDGLVLTRASDIEAAPIDWLWMGLIPSGRLTVLSGDPGLGKSQLTALFAGHATTGRVWPDGSPGPNLGSAIMIGCEDDASDTVRPRLEAAGADLGRVHILDGTRDRGSTRRFNLIKDLPSLEEELEKLGDVRLIAIDPVNAFTEGVSMGDGPRIRAALDRLQDLARQYGTAVVLVLHHTKHGKGGGVRRVRGSLDITAISRSVLSIVEDPSMPARKLLTPAKSNLAKAGTLGFWIEARTLATGIETSTIVFDPDPVPDEEISPPRPKSAVQLASQFLFEFLADGPKPVSEVEESAAAAGIKTRTLDRARAQLGLKPFRVGKSAWYLGLPKDANGAEGSHVQDVGTLQEGWHPSDDEAAE